MAYMTQAEKITHMKSEGWEVGKMLGYQEEDAGAILTNLNDHYSGKMEFCTLPGGWYHYQYAKPAMDRAGLKFSYIGLKCDLGPSVH